MSAANPRTLADLVALDDRWVNARLDVLRADVSSGCAGLTAQDIADDILDAVAIDHDGDDVWHLIDEIMAAGR